MSGRGPSGAPGGGSNPGGPRSASFPVACGMEGCRHSTHLRLLGPTPFEAFRFEEEGWTVVEDMDDGRTVFLCPDCAEAFEEEMEEEDAKAEGDGEEESEDDEEDEDDDDESPAS